MEATRLRILDAARELLGHAPDASMSDVAAAAGVVRRTLYGYFPARSDLVRALATQAAAEMTTLLQRSRGSSSPADEVWAQFVTELWPLAHRYRVLLALRRGNHGAEIHTVLHSVDEAIAGVISHGQEDGVFGMHLPPDVLARLSSATVFALADERRDTWEPDASGAVTTSLLMLGVPAHRVSELVA